MRSPLIFIKAAGKLGLAGIFAAIVLLAISVKEHLSDHNVSGYIFVLVSALLFCAGAYLAWSNEHEQLLKEQDKNQKPKLRMEVLELVCINPNPNTGYSYLARVSVVNESQAQTTLKAAYINPRQRVRTRASTFGSVDLTRTKFDTKTSGTPGTPEVPKIEIVKDLLTLSEGKAMGKGLHSEGWLLFPATSSWEMESLSIEFFVEDGYGYEYGPFKSAKRTETGIVVSQAG